MHEPAMSFRAVVFTSSCIVPVPDVALTDLYDRRCIKGDCAHAVEPRRRCLGFPKEPVEFALESVWLP